MYLTIEDPKEHISKDAVKVWRIANTIGHLAGLAVFLVLIACAEIFGWYSWIHITLYIATVILILSAIYSIFVEPIYLQRTWRYQIDSEFIQLKHGKWQVNHTIIPMEKVEYVRTEQGPLLRRYNLYTIAVGTTTSNHTIPAIPSEQANIIKSQIATYAKIQDTDPMEGDRGI